MTGAITLGQLAEKTATLEVACSRCDRKGRLRVSKLIDEHGAGMGLPVLKTILAGDCPRLQASSIYDHCGGHFPELPKLFC